MPFNDKTSKAFRKQQILYIGYFKQSCSFFSNGAESGKFQVSQKINRFLALIL
jgi:hypothetical protein